MRSAPSPSSFILAPTAEDVANSSRTGVAYLGWANISTPAVVRGFSCELSINDLPTYGTYIEMPFVMAFGANPADADHTLGFAIRHGVVRGLIATQGGALPQTYGSDVYFDFGVYIPKTMWIGMELFGGGSDFTYVARSGLLFGESL